LAKSTASERGGAKFHARVACRLRPAFQNGESVFTPHGRAGDQLTMRQQIDASGRERQVHSMPAKGV